MPRKIGIIGRGNVGSALDHGLRAEYETRTCGHAPQDVRDVAAWADVLVLAVPYQARENALDEMGEENYRGKVLVDVTNPLTESYELAVEPTKGSGAEELARWAEGARVVKSFNHVFAERMTDGRARGEPLTLFVASDDQDAKSAVMDLGRAIGFDPVDSGPLRNARWKETLGYFNIQLATSTDLGRDIGFKLVH